MDSKQTKGVPDDFRPKQLLLNLENPALSSLLEARSNAAKIISGVDNYICSLKKLDYSCLVSSKC